MKNNFKVFIKIFGILIGIIILSIVIDIICILTLNRPLLAIKQKDGYTYYGIFYDTYNCPTYSAPQITSKKTKLSCEDYNEVKVVKIEDTSKTVQAFTCDEALEGFYEDEEYIYYFECIKSDYVIVYYNSGVEESVKNALKEGKISISDLDSYNISYIKEKKNEGV